MNNIFKLCFTCLISFLALLYPTGVTYAQEASIEETIYLNGGIGQEEVEEMNAKAKDYNLRLYLSEGNPAHAVTNAQIIISDKKGNTLLDLISGGPRLFVKTNRGSYKITAKFKDVTIKRNVIIDSRQGKNIYINWKSTGNDIDIISNDNLIPNN